jgi:hypothetical protein
MVLCSSCDGVPLKFKKKKGQAQITRTDFFSLVLTPLRIRWTMPLRALMIQFIRLIDRVLSPPTVDQQPTILYPSNILQTWGAQQ